MIDIAAAFAATYDQAREKFRAAARARQLDVISRVHPTARGAQGEDLSADLALFGDAQARALLLLTSAMHGVEGFCGSGCQVALLQDDAVAAAIERSGVAVLFYHAVNPYGFSHLRRVNEDNIDVNRNFRDFSVPQPANAAYAQVHGVVVPDTWPPSSENTATLGDYVAKYGAARMQAVITSGQCEFPDGLFYAGRAPSWSNATLRGALAEYGASRGRLGWIDFHTGLGAWGHGEKIFSGPDDAPMIARAYGTRPLAETLQALRADQWLANHPDAGEPLRTAIKRQMRHAFHDDREAWQALAYGQARVAVLQALRGLAATPALDASSTRLPL